MITTSKTTNAQARLSVTVIIPTYNRAALVALAVESVLSQTRVPDEILVIDDGSTDDTAQVLARFAAPVRVLSQPNRGRSAARNAGLQAAQGDLILFLDSDDVLMPECVQHCAEILEREPEVSVVYTDAHVISGTGQIVARYSEVLRGYRPSGMILGELARRCFITVSSMVRRQALAGEQFELGAEHCEDYDLWRRLSARCNFRYLDEPLLCYRFHEQMTNATQHQAILTSEVEVQQRFMAMPEFGRLSRAERARVYCVHGIKNAMLDRTGQARHHFWRSVTTWPFYVGGLPLFVISLFGPRALRAAIVARRRLAGNQLGTPGGPLAVVAAEPKRESSCPEVAAEDSLVLAAEKT